jgi:hypothetical protein
VRKSFDQTIIFFGIMGFIFSIGIAYNPIFLYPCIAITIIGLFVIFFKDLKDLIFKKHEILVYGRHTGLYAAIDLIKRGDNCNIKITRFIKNVKYTDSNKTSNVTYIINGEVTDNFSTGFYLLISAGSPTDNIKKIGYSIIVDEKDQLVNDDFHFIDGSNIEKLLPYNMQFQEMESTPFAKKIFLPFQSGFVKGDKFQAILYYTWNNSILDLKDSTSYLTKKLFPNGIDKLITNLVFTKRPLEVVIFKVHRDNKQRRIDTVKNIRQSDNLFIIRWEIEKPEETYILERRLENWG